MAAFLGERRKSPRPESVLQARDTSTTILPASRLIRGVQPRDAETVAARLGEQFLTLNGPSLALVGAEGALRHNGRNVAIELRTSTSIGAVPLMSPLTGRSDLGLIVRPRFPWDGLGKVLAQSGMQTLPTLLPLGQLPHSDREVPPWVLSSVVLERLRHLIRSVVRRFVGVEQELLAPRGGVNWNRWLTGNFARGRPDLVPCRVPELQVDAEMMGFVRHVLNLQRASLEGQRGASDIVRALLSECEALLQAVERWPAKPSAAAQVAGWIRRPLTSFTIREGLTAGLWTVEQRGLAGNSELAGLPWRLDMDLLFENWAAAMLSRWAPKQGFSIRTGQRHQTNTPLFWDPPYAGSQRSLIPDIVLSRGGLTVVVDAKYKSHWDEMDSASRWTAVAEEVRDAHRNDLLQVLAYTTSHQSERVIGLLLYPCQQATWEKLKARGQLLNRASVAAGARRVDLLLAALPFTAHRHDAEELFDGILEEF